MFRNLAGWFRALKQAGRRRQAGARSWFPFLEQLDIRSAPTSWSNVSAQACLAALDDPAALAALSSQAGDGVLPTRADHALRADTAYLDAFVAAAQQEAGGGNAPKQETAPAPDADLAQAKLDPGTLFAVLMQDDLRAADAALRDPLKPDQPHTAPGGSGGSGGTANLGEWSPAALSSGGASGWASGSSGGGGSSAAATGGGAAADSQPPSDPGLPARRGTTTAGGPAKHNATPIRTPTGGQGTMPAAATGTLPADGGGNPASSSPAANPAPTPTRSASEGEAQKPPSATTSATHGPGLGADPPAGTPPAPADPVPESVSSPLIDLDHVAPGAEGNIPSLFSPSGVRYSDGAVKLAFGDLSSNGFGMPFGITRTWTNLTSTANGFSGSGMLIDQLPHLRQDPGGTLTAVANGFNVRYFDSSGGSYTARFFVQDTFTADSTNHQYVQTDSAGNVIKYNDFTVTPANEQGAFKSFTDPNGNAISVTSWTADGKVQEIQRSNGSLIESYLLSYISSGTNAGLVSSVVLRRSTNGGTTWTTVRQVQYTYYSGEAHGNTGDLKLAQVQDGSGNTLDTTYYRYYTGESGGYTHGLKYVFRPDSYARLIAGQGSSIDSISDANAAPYADDYFEYDASQRVTKHTVAGAGGTVGGNGLGTYTYSYTTSANPNDFNKWATKCVETLPDGTTNTVYTNAYGEVMLKVFSSGGNNWEWFFKYDGSGRAILLALPSAVTGYNDTYADLLNYSGGSYQYLSNSSGLITDLDYGTSTTATPGSGGDALGYYKDAKVQQGQTGSAITLTSQNYYKATAGSTTTFPVAGTTRYRNTDGSGGETVSYTYTFYTQTVQPREVDVSQPSITTAENGPNAPDTFSLVNDSYGRLEWRKDGDGRLFYTAYDQATGATTKQIADVNTNNTSDFTDLPSGWSSGSNPLHLITQMAVDALGRTTKLTDPLGNVTYTAFNDRNYEVRVYPGWNSTAGAPTGPTQDYRSDRPGSYAEALSMSAAPHLASAPAAPGLGQTSGGSLPATTYYVKVTYLVNGGETAASAESSLAVAANSLLQVSSPTAATGATGYNVYVATASGQEVLQNGSAPVPLGTTWTEPTGGLVTGTAPAPATGKVPDGAEAVGNVQSLSRTYANSAGEAVRKDDYFNLSGVSWSTAQYIGTQNTNFSTTQYDFDNRGRQYRTLTPTGTYYKILYDGLNRPVSKWVGTNDGSPGNMTQATGYVYDGSQGAVSQTTGVGDGNLTQKVEYPGGGAANRVTNYWYDWRDRQVASKPGVQSNEDTTTHRPITYLSFDNLDEATKVQRFDGDTVTLTISGGVPQAPSSSLLRAETDYSYDEQRRVYQQQDGQVDPVNGGNPTQFLSTWTWFNHRGLVMESRAPGGLSVKYAFDGAGRVTTAYQTDANGDAAPGQNNNWNNAGTVGSNNNVLQQVEPTYDADGNVTLTTTRQRFHDETTGGALGNATTAPKARVSYVAGYYDAANRFTALVNVGTNGGSAYTRPSTPDARSDTVLRTDTGYAGDSVQQVSLTGNPTGGTFTLTFNGQTTSAIAYNASAATVQSALQALSSIGSNNALVAPAASGGWTVRFAGTLAPKQALPRRREGF
jgi:hypothetical protein